MDVNKFSWNYPIIQEKFSAPRGSELSNYSLGGYRLNPVWAMGALK